MADQTPNFRIARTPRRSAALGGSTLGSVRIGEEVFVPSLHDDGRPVLDHDREVRAETSAGYPFYIDADCLEPIRPTVSDEHLAKGFAAIGHEEITPDVIGAARKVADVIAEVSQ